MCMTWLITILKDRIVQVLKDLILSIMDCRDRHAEGMPFVHLPDVKLWRTIISSELLERPYQIDVDFFQSSTNGGSVGGLFRSSTESLIRVFWTVFTQSSTDGFYRNSGDGLFWTWTDGIVRVPWTALSSTSHGWPFSEFNGRVLKTPGSYVKYRSAPWY